MNFNEPLRVAHIGASKLQKGQRKQNINNAPLKSVQETGKREGKRKRRKERDGDGRAQRGFGASKRFA